MGRGLQHHHDSAGGRDSGPVGRHHAPGAGRFPDVAEYHHRRCQCPNSAEYEIGHGLMNNHPFADARFEQANRNFTEIIKVLKEGNIEKFNSIVIHAYIEQ